MKMLEHQQNKFQSIQRLYLTINQYLAFLLILVGCTHPYNDIMNIDDPLQSYQYIVDPRGILKLIHGHNQIILFNNCIEKIDIVDNVANNLQYELTNWTDDTIEINIIFEEDQRDIYKQMFYKLKEYKHSLGNYEINYCFKLNSNKMFFTTEPYIIDSFKIDSESSYIHMFFKGQLMANVAIKELSFSSGKIILKHINNDEAVFKEVQLINELKNSHILKEIIEDYKDNFCQKVLHSSAQLDQFTPR